MTTTSVLPPASLQDITVLWLNEALAPHLVQKRTSVVSCAVEPIDESSGGTGIYGMVSIEYESSDAALPAKLFAKIYRHSEHVPLPAAQYRTEVAFYQHLGNNSGVRVPDMMYGGFDAATGRAGMLMQDMSAHRPGDTTIGCSLDDAKAVVNAAADLHARWWRNPEIDSLDWLFDISAIFASVRTASLSDVIRTGRIVQYVPPGSYGAAVARALAEEDQHLIGPPVDPTTLIHGDYRLDNIFFDDTKTPTQPIVFDWGIIAPGNAALDLACFLTTAVDSLTLDAEIALLDGYLGLLSIAAHKYEMDQLMKDYRIAVLQIYHRRLNSVTHSYDLPIESPLNQMRVKALERSLAAIERHQCLDLLA